MFCPMPIPRKVKLRQKKGPASWGVDVPMWLQVRSSRRRGGVFYVAFWQNPNSPVGHSLGRAVARSSPRRRLKPPVARCFVLAGLRMSREPRRPTPRHDDARRPPHSAPTEAPPSTPPPSALLRSSDPSLRHEAHDVSLALLSCPVERHGLADRAPADGARAHAPRASGAETRVAARHETDRRGGLETDRRYAELLRGPLRMRHVISTAPRGRPRTRPPRRPPRPPRRPRRARRAREDREHETAVTLSC